MPGEKAIYRNVIHDFTQSADLETQRLVWADFGEHLLPKVEKILPVIVPKHQNQILRFKIWDLGLDKIGVMIMKASLAGQDDQSSALSRLEVKAAARHMRDLADSFALEGVTTPDPEQLSMGLRAGRHMIIAIEDLRKTATGAESLVRQDRTLLTLATCLIQQHPSQVLRLFEADGRNEINQAINSLFQRSARSTRAYPG